MVSLALTIRHFWLAMTAQDPAGGSASPEVIVHDPYAALPHNLDDPFFDPEVQRRMASVIANSAKKSH